MGVHWVIYGHGLTKLVMQVSVNYSCRVPAWLNAVQAKNLLKVSKPWTDSYSRTSRKRIPKMWGFSGRLREMVSWRTDAQRVFTEEEVPTRLLYERCMQFLNSWMSLKILRNRVSGLVHTANDHALVKPCVKWKTVKPSAQKLIAVTYEIWI